MKTPICFTSRLFKKSLADIMTKMPRLAPNRVDCEPLLAHALKEQANQPVHPVARTCACTHTNNHNHRKSC